MTTPLTGHAKTAAARAANTARKHARWAEEMRAAGWHCTAPATAGAPRRDVSALMGRRRQADGC